MCYIGPMWCYQLSCFVHTDMSLYLFYRWHGLQCTVKGKFLLKKFSKCYISKSHMLKLPFCLLSLSARRHHLKGRGFLSPYQSQHLKFHLVFHPAVLCHLPLMQQDLLLLFHPLRDLESEKLECLSSQYQLLKVCLLVAYALCMAIMAIVIDYTNYYERRQQGPAVSTLELQSRGAEFNPRHSC